MGLTSAQRYEKIVRTNAIRPVQKRDEEDFIFISYKSDDWEIVLSKIVRKLESEFRLKVYFDKEIEAINSPHCKGIIAFVSKSYMESSTCLKELSESNLPTSRSQTQWKDEPMGIIPLLIDGLNSLEDTTIKSTETSNAMKKILAKYPCKIATQNDESFYQDIVETIKNLECSGKKIGNDVFRK